MGFVISLIVVAVGAVLRFATNMHSSAWNIRTIGDILIVVGVIGFVLAAIEWVYWEGWGESSFRHRRTTVIQDSRPPVHGPDGYARTTYDGMLPAHPPADPTTPVDTVVEEEERSLW